MPLDRSRPYAEVCGLPGAAFEQDGIMYKHDGSLATPEHIVEEPEPYNGPEINPPSVSCIEAQSPPVDVKDGQVLDDMHWRKLKILVESFDGTWTTRENAIKFIRGRK